jgi:hypothetical protein
MRLADHPTVKALGPVVSDPAPIGAAELRQLALDCGAADAGLVEISRSGLDPQREEILRHYPWTKTLISFVTRMARGPIQAPPPVGRQSRISSGRT